MFLFGTKGSISIKTAGWSVAAGGVIVIMIAVLREGSRLSGFADHVPTRKTLLYSCRGEDGQPLVITRSDRQ